jgi:phenylalanyl-tRNA synthetase beta subunit
LHACGTASVEPNEQIMQIMQSLGIDMQKTCKSLKVSVPFIYQFNVRKLLGL